MTSRIKRKGLSDGDARTSPKRRKAAPELASCPKPKFKAPLFQCFHLLLLQSMYENNHDIPGSPKDNDSVGSATNDDLSEILEESVDNKLWEKARKFISERDHLIKLKKEAGRVNDVHQEALSFMEEQQGLESPSTPSGKQVASAWRGWTDDDGHSTTRSGAGLPRRSINSPASLTFFSPGKSASQQSKSLSTPPQCFGLVIDLLEKRSLSSNSNVKLRSNPYGPLLQASEEKIEALRGKLDRLQENALSKQKQKVEDLLSRALLSSYDSIQTSGSGESSSEQFDMKSLISKLETKLQLWKMLATDLRVIVSICARGE